MVSAIKQPQVKTKHPTRQDTRRLPHERDESDDSQASRPRSDIKQAYDDLKDGQMNTDLRGVQGADFVSSPPDNSSSGKARRNAPREK